MNQCFMVKNLSVAVVYIHVPNDDNHQIMGSEFITSYMACDPGYPHESVIICNGSAPTRRTRELFSAMENPRFIEHDDSGWDIGGYQKAAKDVPCQLMVFFGGSTKLCRPRWLGRMVDAFKKHGPALYGTMGNRGDSRVNVFPHIRTTGFWLPPSLMNEYPIRVTQNSQRYEFEHGKTCLTGWVKSKGLKVFVVSWDGEYEWEQWDNIPNGFHRGDQSNLLVRDRLTEPPYYHI